MRPITSVLIHSNANKHPLTTTALTTEQQPRDSRMEISNLLNNAEMQDNQGSRLTTQTHTEQHQRHRLHDLMDIATAVNPSTENRPTTSIAQSILASMIPTDVTLEQQQALQQRLQTSQAHLVHANLSSLHKLKQDAEDYPNYSQYKKMSSGTKNISLFINAYNPEKTHFLALKNMRIPGDKIYASDAALKQMAMAEKGRENMTTPSKLPSTITRETISNTHTLKVVETLLSKYKDIEDIPLVLNLASPNSSENSDIKKLLETPNGKTTTNLIRDFNTLTGTDYYISQAQIPVHYYLNSDDIDIDFTLSKLSASPDNQ